MKKNILQIEEMPFFEKLQDSEKAIINITAFEKWIRERLNTGSETEQTFSLISAAGDDPFFTDNAVYQGDAPYDTSEKHDTYLYGDA